jgi:hypothetical protein
VGVGEKILDSPGSEGQDGNYLVVGRKKTTKSSSDFEKMRMKVNLSTWRNV